MDKRLLHNIFNNDDCLAEQQLLNYVNNSLSNIERNQYKLFDLIFLVSISYPKF